MSANPFELSDDPSQNPFDIVYIAGGQLPGLASIWTGSKPSRKYKWDKKEGAGTAGDILTYRGSRTVEFVIDLTFWEADQVDAWDAMYPTLTPDGKSGVDITHPTLDRLGVKSIVIEEIVQLFPKGGGQWGVQIGVNEYAPPPKTNVTTTPNGSSNTTAKSDADKPPTAQTAQEKEIQDLLAEAKKP